MDRKPAAYVRKSAKLEDSAAAQLAAVKRVAERDGVKGDDLLVYSDVGVSGRRHKRDEATAWARLLEDIAADKLSTVYVSVLDRAGRSILEWLVFSELLVKHSVRLVDQSGENRADERDEDRALFEVWAAQKEGKKAVERSARAFRTMRARGDEMVGGYKAAYGYKRAKAGDVGLDGDPKRIVVVPNPDEPLQPLLDAIKATKGNVLQAARRLDAEGVSYRGGRLWNVRVLTDVLEREGALAPRHGSQVRRRAPSDAPLSRLVYCHCGRLMTPQRDSRNGKWLSLLCMPGCIAGRERHGRYVARSRYVIETLQNELHFYVIHIEKSSGQSDAAKRRAALDAKREKLQVALDNDLVTVDEFKQRAAQLKRDYAELKDDAAVEVDWVGLSPKEPLVDWAADEATIGESLRRLVRSVKLDENMLPVADGIEWRAPWLARRKSARP